MNVFTLSTFFVLVASVTCWQRNDRRDQDDSSEGRITRWTFDDEKVRQKRTTERNVGCTGAFVSSAYELKQKVLEFEACQPKMAVVTQNVTDTSSTYSSNSILVQQCGGKCSNPNHSCMPPEDSEMKIVEYPMLKYKHRNTRAAPSRGRPGGVPSRLTGQQLTTMCYVYRAPIHETCGCRCAISEANCDPEVQVFDAKNCKCQCKESTFSCPPEKIFNIGSCKCSCINRTQCSTPLFFSEDTCSCQSETGFEN